MKDPAVIEETTSTSPTDRDPGDDSPMADVLADAAELHREADAAEEPPMPTEAVSEGPSPDPVEAVIETTVTEAPAEDAAAEEPIAEVAAPIEEPVVEEPVAEVAAVVEVAAAETAAVEEAPPADDPLEIRQANTLT